MLLNEIVYEIMNPIMSLPLRYPITISIFLTIIYIFLYDHSTGKIYALYRRYIRDQYFKQSIAKVDENFAQRVKTLTTSLDESVTLIGLMQAEIEARQALINELAADSKTYKKLMELDQDELKAITSTLNGAVSHGNKKTFQIELIKDVILFILGLAVSFFIR